MGTDRRRHPDPADRGVDPARSRRPLTVVDASVVVEVLWGRGGPGTVTLLAAQGPLTAPGLIDLEVVSALRRLVLTRQISEASGRTMLRRDPDLRIARRDHAPLLPRVWELRHQLTPYDAAYVALAEQEAAVLLTRDARLAAAHGIRCEVRLVS
ncbi:MAG: type II toxin-antitoxin system VapC family toxin [Chloroflexota bacterium]